MLGEGEVAPDFAIGGWSLAEASKKGPVLLAFFKISCPTCQLAFPFLQRLADASAPIIAISQDDETGTAQFHKHFQISLPTLLDRAPAYKASNLYGVQNVPSLFLIEPDGRISMAVNGFSKSHLEQLGARFGVEVFRTGEDAPAFRPG